MNRTSTACEDSDQANEETDGYSQCLGVVSPAQINPILQSQNYIDSDPPATSANSSV